MIPKDRIPSPRIIDIHSHIYPEPYLQLLEGRLKIPRVINRDGKREFLIFSQETGSQITKGRPMGPEYWVIEEKLAFMDKFGVDRSLISLGNPWMDPFPNEAGDKATVTLNQILGSYEEITNGRLVSLGVLPTSSVALAANTVEMIARTKGLYGATTGPSIAGKSFDDPLLEPFWGILAGCGLPLFIHPEDSLPLESLKGFNQSLHFALGFPMETTIALSRLVLSGVLARFPSLRIIVAHGGGCLPFLGGRLDAVHRIHSSPDGLLPNPPSSYLQQLYLDALVYYAPAFQAAYSLVGEKHLMFGTDHPFSIADPEVNITTIKEEVDTPDTYHNIMESNAVQLFGLKDARSG